jgi:hypothetical protein
MMAGVNPGAVQRILRHSDPRVTTETYGHLQPDYLRSEIDRLRFGTAPANDLSKELQPSAANRYRCPAPRRASASPLACPRARQPSPSAAAVPANPT